VSVETLIADVEQALVRLVRLGLGERLATVAHVAALAQVDVGALAGLELAYVTGSGAWEWLPDSTSSPDGVDVVAATSSATGRWHRVVTPWTYGAGGTNLGQKPTGYLKAAEAYSSDDTEALLDRLFGAAPAVVVTFEGDEPQSLDMIPGVFYRDVLTFMILVSAVNLRTPPAATQGYSAEAGAYQIIGDLRRLFCGVAPEPGIPGVERLEIGRVDRMVEDINQRVFVFSMELRVRASFYIDEEDGAAAWSIQAQPALTAPAPDATTFDPQNYVISGCGLVEGHGPGLARTIAAAICKVAGSVVTADALAVTFGASKDTYRDLDAEGWHLSAVDADAPAPALAAGRLRVGVTRTDGDGVVLDRELCSYSVAFGSPIVVSLAAE
jgi:phage gp37-like protein